MIVPPGRAGVAFTEQVDGDQRGVLASREAVARALGIADAWATVSQVHGARVLRVSEPGIHGDADALWTTTQDLPLAVFTADCLGVVLHAPEAVGVAHAGWRGVQAGVVQALRDSMASEGHEPERAEVGPGIGPCCFEVGLEVGSNFSGHQTTTTWETDSVDLVGAVREKIGDLDIWTSGECTLHGDRWYSHRSDATSKRLATIGWRK